MGVSLERVQFKFASIIGELCSDPVILSQFAVWVDLKMAEYKANGAMSLDCSGDQPKPSWMKGVVITISGENETNDPRKGIGVIGESDLMRPDTPVQTVSKYVSSSVTSSPDLILIRDEDSNQEELFSPDSQRNSYPSKTIPTSRKRYLQEQTFDTRKCRRSASPVFSQTPATSNQNESLLSVLGEGLDPCEEERVTAIVNRLVPPDLSTPYPSYLHQPVPLDNQALPNSTLQSLESSSKTESRLVSELTTTDDSPMERASELFQEILGKDPNQQGQFVCKSCSYHTPKLYNMRRHVSIHKPDLKLKCPICLKGFIDKYQVLIHVRRKHTETHGAEIQEFLTIKG